MTVTLQEYSVWNESRTSDVEQTLAATSLWVACQVVTFKVTVPMGRLFQEIVEAASWWVDGFPFCSCSGLTWTKEDSRVLVHVAWMVHGDEAQGY